MVRTGSLRTQSARHRVDHSLVGRRLVAHRKLRDEGIVKIQKFDDALLKAFLAISKDVVTESGSGDELSKKIYRSYEDFRASIMDWSDIAERAFLNSRRLV